MLSLLKADGIGDAVAFGWEMVLMLKILVGTKVEAGDEVEFRCEVVDVWEEVGIG